MSKQTSESLFNLDDFRPYIRVWAVARGRGEYRKIALALGIHSTLLSQILGGRKCLTEEQASAICAYMNLTQVEADYFLKLVQVERAGSELLRATYRRHLGEMRVAAQEVRGRVLASKGLAKEDRALYYSSWHYTMIRLLTSISDFQTPSAIAHRLGLSISRVQEVLDFLTTRGLCVKTQHRYKRTDKNTHIDAKSPLVTRHHQNWRLKIAESIERSDVDDLIFTAPISIGEKDLPKVRAILLEAIGQISKLVDTSPSEKIAYLGIDWLKL